MREDVGELRKHWLQVRPQIEKCFRELWRNPELPCMESRSAGYLADWLHGGGFELERGIAGLPTAFKASWSSGSGPRITLLAEYDALLGPENAATPFRNRSGGRVGHACGHNQIAGANAGAAIAAIRFLKQRELPGTISVIGCPAEEIVWGKIALNHASVFDDSDVLLTSHADYQNGALSRPCQSVVHGEFVFCGEAGHAGRIESYNVVEALEQFVQSMMREKATSFPGTIVRWVIRNGGDMPVVVPDEVRIWISTRQENFLEARSAYRRIEELAEKTARQAGVHCKHQFISESRGYLPNNAIAGVLLENLRMIGPPDWSESDLAWQQELARSVSPSEPFRLDREIGLFDVGCDPYGQDDGELSWSVPLGRINWAMPAQVPLHHWACAALCGNEASFAGPLMASEALALTAVELVLRPELALLARQELETRTAGIPRTTARLGAVKTLTGNPRTFWDCTWHE